MTNLKISKGELGIKALEINWVLGLGYWILF
jgi:hypothetical protein